MNLTEQARLQVPNSLLAEHMALGVGVPVALLEGVPAALHLEGEAALEPAGGVHLRSGGRGPGLVDGAAGQVTGGQLVVDLQLGPAPGVLATESSGIVGLDLHVGLLL